LPTQYVTNPVIVWRNINLIIVYIYKHSNTDGYTAVPLSITNRHHATVRLNSQICI